MLQRTGYERSQKSKVKIRGKNLKLFKFLLLSCGFAVLLFTFGFNCFAQDKIIAVVNNDCITQKDLDDFVNFMRLELSKEYGGDELTAKIRSLKLDLLDRLIEDRLILQEARRDKITVDENRIKARINEIRKHYPSDMEFQNDLARQGLAQLDIENKIKEQLLMYNIVEQRVRGKIIIKPDEVTAFYNANKKDFFLQEERELEMVTLADEELAKTFSGELKNGQSLTELSVKYSLSPDNLKMTHRGELKKEIEDAVFKLNVGSISEPLKIDDKYYIFKLNNIVPARQLTLSEVQDKIHIFLFERKMQEGLKKWLDELKGKAYIKVTQD